MSPRVAVLIAAFNEEERVGETVRAAAAIDGVYRVVVVDDGSEDETALVAEKAGAKVVRMAFNAGKGAALEAGAYRIEDADIVVLLDADLASTASQAASLIAPVASGEAAMTIATFPRPNSPAGFGFVKRLARWGIRRLSHSEFEATAPLSGQRAMSAECLAAVRPFSAGYGVEVGATIRALRAGFTVLEVPTQMAHAATGRDVPGFIHRGRQFVHVTIALVKLSFEKRR